MNKLNIDPLVFNSHANVDVLAAKAEKSGTDLFEFATQLAEAANHSTKAPYAQFTVQIIGVDEDAPTKGIVDFAILHALMDKKEIAPPETDGTGNEPANDAEEPTSAIGTQQAPAAQNDNETEAKRISASSPMMLKDSPPVTQEQPQTGASAKNDHAKRSRTASKSKKIGVVDSNILDFSFAVT